VNSNAYRLADGLDPLVQRVPEYTVSAQITFTWWDRVANWFRTPDPLIEVESSLEPAEIRAKE
jgi:hypothetical protein